MGFFLILYIEREARASFIIIKSLKFHLKFYIKISTIVNTAVVSVIYDENNEITKKKKFVENVYWQ